METNERHFFNETHLWELLVKEGRLYNKRHPHSSTTLLQWAGTAQCMFLRFLSAGHIGQQHKGHFLLSTQILQLKLSLSDGQIIQV